MSFLYGFHPLREALRHRPHDVQRVLCAAKPGRRRQQIEDLCRRHRVTMDDVPWGRLDEQSDGGVHNGFAAEVRAAATPSAAEGADPTLVVLLEDVQDPRNLGALLRVCEGAGVGRVLVRDRGSAPLTATVAKTAAGAAEHLQVERITNSSQTLEQLKKDGYWAYGADADGQPPWGLDLTGPVVLCLGGEEKGLRDRTRSTCDALVGLPMRGKVASLNVATAAAALLYEAVRQRTQ